MESDISESNKSGKTRTLYRLDGQGKLESKNYRSNKSTYNGRFEGNVRQGHGILTTKDVINDEKVDVEYEGHFEADWPNGQGTLTYVAQMEELPDKASEDPLGLMAKLKPENLKRVFQGNFKKGQVDGFGQVSVGKKAVYQGAWYIGKPHGHGKCDYEELGLTYTGMWETGVMNGEGQITTEKDYVIEGKFKMGQINGKGKRKYKGGKTL